MCYKSSFCPNLHVHDIVLNTKITSIVKEHRYLNNCLQDNQNNEYDKKRRVKAVHSRGNLLADRFRNIVLQMLKLLISSLMFKHLQLSVMGNQQKACVLKS